MVPPDSTIAFCGMVWALKFVIGLCSWVARGGGSGGDGGSGSGGSGAIVMVVVVVVVVASTIIVAN
jgi:hypothetical protein